MKRVFLLILLCGAPVLAETSHSIEEVADSGRLIVLDDDSVWGVELTDSIDSSIWLAADDVKVVKSGDEPAHPYLLINMDEHETVHAKFMGKL